MMGFILCFQDKEIVDLIMRTFSQRTRETQYLILFSRLAFKGSLKLSSVIGLNLNGFF